MHVFQGMKLTKYDRASRETSHDAGYLGEIFIDDKDFLGTLANITEVLEDEVSTLFNLR